MVNGVSSDPMVDPGTFHGFEGYILHFIPSGLLLVSQDYTKVKENITYL
jgi:hypothetical protein